MTNARHRLSVIANHMLSKPLMQVAKASSEHLQKNNIPTHWYKELQFSKQVKHALDNNLPVVALESTIISHGMPFPQNVETAVLVEEQIKKYGATPATIAILDGIIHIGLDKEQLTHLGKLGKKCIKTSRRDIAVVCANKQNGATTVSGTMILAHLAGINVFVTGGIGGVHRGVTETMDISADLTELGRTPLCVVSAGVKSILDIPRTLEYLETSGVTVASFGTSEFPAFFTSKSGYKSHIEVGTTQECARILKSNLDLNLKSGMIVAVPIPKDKEAQTGSITHAIETALFEMDAQKVGGKDATPFLLQRVNELTGGESLKANIALVLNNARIGAQIASDFCKLKNPSLRVNSDSDPNIILIGGAVLDITSAPKPNTPLIANTSNPGSVNLTFGGVARNVHEVLVSKLNVENVMFITAVGSDSFGKLITSHLGGSGDIAVGPNRTAVYNCVMDHTGEMTSAIADMDVLECDLTPQHVHNVLSKKLNTIGQRVVFLDGNPSVQVFEKVCEMCPNNYLLFFDPTSIPKCTKPIIAKCLDRIDYIKPNQDELFAMSLYLYEEIGTRPEVKELNIRDINDCLKLLIVYGGVKNILLTLGADGVIFAKKSKNNSIYKKHFPTFPMKASDRVNVTGCGDNFCGGFIYGIGNGYNVEESILMGMRAAHLTLQSPFAVHPLLNTEYITNSDLK
ncbi:pseudouridine synthase/ kinase [Acrasis kona]|uniref:Pseudouridine synthase/ kinase n=1 Tax=Acrasis kona TaxID=1008807 RepID=A0AAW2YPL5_9EUKA